jgi:hypothetical protein
MVTSALSVEIENFFKEFKYIRKIKSGATNILNDSLKFPLLISYQKDYFT